MGKHATCLLLTLCFLTLSDTASSQYNINENKVWAFGHWSGLDFNNPQPQAISTSITNVGGNALYESSASVCDQYGRLLFYTNGEKVWDRLHADMLNGDQLPPASPMPMVSSSSQGTVITPVIDTPGKYYIFSVTCWEQKRYTPPYDGRLFYSIVDMSLNNNRGGIVPNRKWVQVDTGLTETIIAVPGNSNNIWIITHANYANQFRVWEITASGISNTPQIFSAGISGYKPYVSNNNPQTYENSWWSFGQMAIAPDRKKLAVAYARANYAELYDFDPCTGAVTNPVLIDTIRQLTSNSYFTHSGIAFSPNSQKLYITGVREDFAITNDQYLYQFDITTPTQPAIAASKTKIGRSGNTKLRLGPDGKIYMVNRDSVLSRYLDAVEQPDRSGLACQFTPRRITLNGKTDIGIGNDFAKPLTGPADTVWHKRMDTTVCTFPESGIALTAPAGYTSYRWEDSSADQVRHIHKPGTYYVFYGDDCDFMADSFRIKGAQLPEFQIDGPDSVLCNIDSIVLRIPVDSVNYSWQNGQTTRSLTVTKPGQYIATISQDECAVSDTIDIRFSTWEKQTGTRHVYCQNELIDLHLFSGSDAAPGTEIVWSDGTDDLYKPVQDTGIYSVTITNGNCVYSDTFFITREVCFCHPLIPNAFTPNGDGKNDVFRVILPADCFVHEFSLRIYDRWGVMVFATTDPLGAWNGYHNGIPTEAGTYMYHLQIKSGTRMATYNHKGDITLLR